MRKCYEFAAEIGGFIMFWTVIFVLIVVTVTIVRDRRKSHAINKTFKTLTQQLKVDRNASD